MVLLFTLWALAVIIYVSDILGDLWFHLWMCLKGKPALVRSCLSFIVVRMWENLWPLDEWLQGWRISSGCLGALAFRLQRSARSKRCNACLGINCMCVYECARVLEHVPCFSAFQMWNEHKLWSNTTLFWKQQNAACLSVFTGMKTAA